MFKPFLGNLHNKALYEHKVGTVVKVHFQSSTPTAFTGTNIAIVRKFSSKLGYPQSNCI